MQWRSSWYNCEKRIVKKPIKEQGELPESCPGVQREEVANMAVSTQSRVQRVPGTVAVCRTEESAERASFGSGTKERRCAGVKGLMGSDLATTADPRHWRVSASRVKTPNEVWAPFHNIKPSRTTPRLHPRKFTYVFNGCSYRYSQRAAAELNHIRLLPWNRRRRKVSN